MKINGAVARDTSSLEEMLSSTRLVPLFPSSWKVRYSHTMSTPAAGARNRVQEWLSQKAVTHRTAMLNTAPITPTVSPMTQEIKVHFRK